MISTVDVFKENLRNNNMSVTAARTLVFEALEQHGPLTMNELSNLLSSKVNRASVYRTIDLFEKLQIVQRLTFGWKYKIELSNQFQEHHHHLSCLHCGALVSFHEQPLLEEQITTIALQYGFTLMGHQIELQGYCKNCSPKT